MVYSFINLKKQVNGKKCVGNNQTLVGIIVSIGVDFAIVLCLCCVGV